MWHYLLPVPAKARVACLGIDDTLCVVWIGPRSDNFWGATDFVHRVKRLPV